MTPEKMPRELSAEERAILERLLMQDFLGRDALRTQLPVARVIGPDCSCGCPGIFLKVDTGRSARADLQHPMYIMEAAGTHDGGDLIVLTLKASEGYLSELEVTPMVSDPTKRHYLPDLDSIGEPTIQGPPPPLFKHQLLVALHALETARRKLLDALSSVSDADLDRAPRGHWPVRRVLEHVIWHEQIYVRMIAHLRGAPSPGDMPDNTPSSISDALERLTASRSALLTGIDGVDEETFYKLGKMGYEEYSILSMLENEANHEREHAAQIKKTLA